VSELTRLLDAADRGDAAAADQMLPLVYRELRQLAAHKLAGEAPGQTLQPTALVHEAWLRLGGTDGQWKSRTHFFAAAATAMQRILIDRARRKQAQRHGGGQQRVDVTDLELASPGEDEEILALNDALEALASHSPQKAELVRLRYFAGLKLEEVAALLEISEPTVKRHWAYARAWLLDHIQKQRAH
jgi:RNA polymerase sigma factor (TIGR02999 family)